jgi:hypothetical protein
MALFFECMLLCAQKLLDTADIVREAMLRQPFKHRRKRSRSAVPDYTASGCLCQFPMRFLAMMSEKPGTIIALMAFRFEFDPFNKALIARFDGRLTLQSAMELHQAVRQRAIATDPSAVIIDLSLVTEFAGSSEDIRRIELLEPANTAERPSIIVAPAIAIYGLARMFQIVGERKRPLLNVVHTMGDALAALGIQSSHFEPLE